MSKKQHGSSGLSGAVTDDAGDIRQATVSYDNWMRRCTTVILSDLRLKHERMKESTFFFLRGTFYRWAQLWPALCAELCGAPRVLSVGDLHVNSFGTWRDAEGRLCWGVDDFDESYPLPYTNDLVRLAASMKIVADAGGLSVKPKEGCEAILEGYCKSLKEGGRPVVLAEHEHKLGKLGVDSFKPPTDFWGKLNRLPVVTKPLGSDVKRALGEDLARPEDGIQVGTSASRVRQSWPAKICGDCQLARRMHCSRSQGSPALCMHMAGGQAGTWAVVLPTSDLFGDTIA